MKQFFKTLGPGLLFASTAIGVSHLVQSTRAGANYGFALLIFVLLANVLKFPFFEFGSRYASATKTSLIDGYSTLGKWALWLYLLIMVGSMFFVCAAVGFVTAGFLENLFQLKLPKTLFYLPSLCLFMFCVLVLAIGKYKALDSFIKVIGIALLLSTLTAFVIALINGPVSQQSLFPKSAYSVTALPFIIALMGWMPTAVDLSTWNSLWTLERIKQTGFTPSLKQTLTEFNFGYWVSAGLSVCFVTLGAFLMFGVNQQIPAKSAQFAASVVTLYTQTIGSWSYFIIAIAGFCIMLGTSIGVFDGYARAINKTTHLLFGFNETKRTYVLWLLVTATGGFFVILFFVNNLKQLVDIATTISFLIAPIIAVINYKLVTAQAFPKQAQPKLGLRVLSILGIVFLSVFSVVYIYYIVAIK